MFGGGPDVEGEVDEGGNHHSTHRGDGGKDGRAFIPQVTRDQFALDLQADDEEEDGHQTVVDDAAECLVEMKRSNVQIHRGRPELFV